MEKESESFDPILLVDDEDGDGDGAGARVEK